MGGELLALRGVVKKGTGWKEDKWERKNSWEREELKKGTGWEVNTKIKKKTAEAESRKLK